MMEYKQEHEWHWAQQFSPRHACPHFSLAIPEKVYFLKKKTQENVAEVILKIHSLLFPLLRSMSLLCCENVDIPEKLKDPASAH